MDEIKNMLRIGEVAKLLGISTQAVRTHDGKLEPAIVFGQRLYDRARVDEFARARAAKKAG